MLLGVLLAASCSDADGAPRDPPDLGVDRSLRTQGESSRDGQALAAALLWAIGELPDQRAAPRVPAPLSAPSTARLRQTALDHGWASALGSGAGPAIVTSARVRRRAAEPDAPADANGNGTNLDETLRRDLEQLAALAEAAVPDDAVPLLAPGSNATARLPAGVAPRSRDDLAALRTLPFGELRVLTLEQVGQALLAKTRIGMALGGARRGPAVGRTPHDGVLALTMLQQALALDEALLTDLPFDGVSLRPIQDPRAYDPAAGASWLPASWEWVPSRALPAGAGGFVVRDRASDLGGLALVMRAGAELAWLTDPGNPIPELRELFVETPLAPPGGGGPPPDVNTWIDDVQPILYGPAGCVSCHSGPFAMSDYRVATWEETLLAGASGVPAVTPGDHAVSPLWLVLNGPWTPPNRPVPIPRMPFGGNRLPQDQIDTIAKWIDDGALREQPPQRPGPRPGLDVARVLFRNLVALHEIPDGPGAGLLDRRAGEHSRSDLVGAFETGLALQGLAALRAVADDEPGLDAALLRSAHAAIEHLTRADGSVVAEWDVRTALPTERRATLADRAALAAGLLAVARVTGDARSAAAGLAVADLTIAELWHPAESMFDRIAGDPARVLTADALAAVLDALVELRLAGRPIGAVITERFLNRLLPVLVASEFDGLGEVLNDGLPDTDGNGIPEPGAAGRAPLIGDVVAEGPEPRDAAPITWSQHVLPLFRARCVGCHIDGANEGGYRVDTPALAATPGQSGHHDHNDMIVPGDAEASFLYRKLVDRPPPIGAQMPLDRPPLAARERALVRAWIDGGARDR